jgi:hypothetical protein
VFQHHDSADSPGAPATGHPTDHHTHDHDRRAAGRGGHLHPVGNPVSLDRIAFLATLHCLSGCAIGEVLGLVIGTALGLGNAATIALAVALAFTFGYALTMLPLLRHGMAPRQALKLALAADTASIAVMEIVDNLIMLVIPGAMDAGLDTLLFWGSLAFALLLAGIAAFPLNRWLIARGRGHAAVHGAHGHG